METYKEFTIQCTEAVKEQLIAELAEKDFEGFIETEEGFSAYILSHQLNQSDFDSILTKYGVDPLAVPQNIIEQQNWNAQWEAGYEPIIINNQIAVVAPFHEMEISYETELIIKPKNTFGTGHHETTQLMLKMMFETDLSTKTVFDYGCGTGVLGIYASKKGAASVYAIDIDEWSADNVLENAELNNINNLIFERGDLSVVKDQTFDIILANINKNILIASCARLAEVAAPNGLLLISGFYEYDLSDLISAFTSHGFRFQKHQTLNEWCNAMFIKTE